MREGASVEPSRFPWLRTEAEAVMQSARCYEAGSGAGSC